MVEKSRRALRESEQRFRLAFDHAPLGMALIDPDFRFTRVNDTLCAMLGYTPDELLGKSFVDVTHPDDVAEDVGLAERLFSGELPSYELDKRYVTAAGEAVWVHLIGTVIRDDAGRPLYGLAIVENVTARRKAEAEQRRFAERTEQARRLESLGILTGGIAHDFNNLLVGILGEVDLVLDEVGADEPIRGPLERIHEIARRASDVCQQMLAYGGRIRIEPRPVDLGAVARESLRLLKTSFPETVRLEIDLSKAAVVVEGDPTFIRRILSNLVANARQAVSEHGCVGVRTDSRPRRDLLERRSWLGEVPSGPMVGVLEVSDDGVGMDDATRQRAFEPFYTTKGAGRGMGLASVLGLVRSMNGAVRVESAPGRGTTVQVALRLSSGLPDAARHPGRVELDGSVLVVDDDPMVRRVMGAMLERSGLRTVLVDSGEAALRELGERAFRAVILDVEMPGLAGERLLRKVAEAAPDVPVLVTSGYDEGTARSRLGDPSVAGFVQKPFTQASLEEALSSVLEPRGLR